MRFERTRRGEEGGISEFFGFMFTLRLTLIMGIWYYYGNVRNVVPNYE